MIDPAESADNAAYKSIRINVLLAIAYATILICLAIVVWQSGISEYAQGIVTLILGRFLGYTDQVYSFEFGTTRANKTKDDTISNLSAPSAPSTTVTTETKEVVKS